MNFVKKLLLVTGGVCLLSMAGVFVPQAAYAAPVCGSSPTPRCTQFVQTYINPFIVLLSGLAGVFAVISLIIAGIQYSASADDPGAVSKAKQRMLQTVIGILAFIFLYAFLDYLVPGGLVS